MALKSTWRNTCYTYYISLGAPTNITVKRPLSSVHMGVKKWFLQAYGHLLKPNITMTVAPSYCCHIKPFLGHSLKGPLKRKPAWTISYHERACSRNNKPKRYLIPGKAVSTKIVIIEKVHSKGNWLEKFLIPGKAHLEANWP